jgi:uncharacterized cupin superfamily protein
MPKPIVNIDELELRTATSHGETYEARVGAIAPRIGAQKLGYNLTVLAPGKRGFPRHNHRVNEEMFFVIEGEGEVRIGDERHPIRAGDVIACPPGGPETAHQIVNTSSRELRYLAVSTKLSPEIVDYPDSGKFGILADFGPAADGSRRYSDISAAPISRSIIGTANERSRRSPLT